MTRAMRVTGSRVPIQVPNWHRGAENSLISAVFDFPGTVFKTVSTEKRGETLVKKPHDAPVRKGRAGEVVGPWSDPHHDEVLHDHG